MNIEATQEIVIVRHAEPEWVRDGLNVDNPPLTVRGARQAQLVASALAAEHFDEILVSPLQRTRDTAEPILRSFGTHHLVIEDWLEEIRNPIWHGTPVEKAAEAYRADRAKASHERWSGLEGGESVSDFVDRINLGCSLFLEERGIVRRDTDLPVWTTTPQFREGRKTLLVCHAGTGSVAICHMLGLQPTPWEWERFLLGHASISRVQLFALADGATFSLVKLSGDEHLPPEDRTH